MDAIVYDKIGREAEKLSKYLLGTYPRETIESTSISSFADGADDIPIKDLTIDIAPVQSGSGDPAPDNIRPISGWTGANVTKTGKNLLDTKSGKSTTTSAGITAVKNADGSYNVTGTASGIVNLWLRGEWGNNTPIMKLYAGRTYYIKDVTPYSGTAGLGNTVNIGGSTAYTPSNDVFVTGIRATTPNGTTLNTVIHPYIGLVPYAEWQPFGDTYSITFPSEAGTVYGGTLNVTTGALTVTHGNIASYAGETLPGEWISDRDVYVAGTTPSTGAQVVYELATPQTYQLTPTEVRTLLGTNNIWADTGDVAQLIYRADPGAYFTRNSIENYTKFAGIISGVESGMTASKAYTAGQYFIVGQKLYKATTNIASGAAFTVGTNCQETTVGAELIALSA